MGKSKARGSSPTGRGASVIKSHSNKTLFPTRIKSIKNGKWTFVGRFGDKGDEWVEQKCAYARIKEQMFNRDGCRALCQALTAYMHENNAPIKDAEGRDLKGLQRHLKRVGSYTTNNMNAAKSHGDSVVGVHKFVLHEEIVYMQVETSSQKTGKTWVLVFLCNHASKQIEARILKQIKAAKKRGGGAAAAGKPAAGKPAAEFNELTEERRGFNEYVKSRRTRSQSQCRTKWSQMQVKPVV